MLRIGHRGAAGYEPENTLLSIQKALDLDVEAIELDAHVCKSGEIVLIHDVKVDRTTESTGLIAKKNLTELKKLNAGKGEKIPTLEEALDLINRKSKIIIELKGKGTANSVYKIINKYISEKDWDWNDFLISSSLIQELRDFKKLTSQIETGLIVNKKLIGILGIIFKTPFGFIEMAESANAKSIYLSKYFCNKKSISEAKNRGFAVLAWTINSPREIEKLKSCSIDGIISDYPDRI